jgi:uncharacterized protein (DUF58 family)
VKNNDQVGLLLFSNDVELYIPPKKGRAQVYRIIRELLYFKPKGTRTNLSAGLDYLRGVLKKRATVFLLSDFQDKNYEPSLRLLERKHEVIAGLVQDETEFLFPDVGVVELHDSETGEKVLVDTSNPAFRADMEAKFKNDFEVFQKNLAKSRVRSFSFAPDDNFHHSLLAFFKRKKGK